MCKEVNDCYPNTKLFKFGPADQWAMGTLDTCKYPGPTKSFVRHFQFDSWLKRPYAKG